MDLLTNLMSLLIIAGPIFIVIVVGAAFYRAARTAGNPSVPDVSGASSMPEKPGAVAWVVGALLAGWLIAALALEAAGFFEAVPGQRVPGLSYALVPVLIGLGLLWLSPAFRQVLDRIPQHRLIGVQVYRVIGSVFLISYAQGKLPGEFAISAGIGDTVVGLTAPVVALLVLAQHPWAFRLAVVWNIPGLCQSQGPTTRGNKILPSSRKAEEGGQSGWTRPRSIALCWKL